MPTERRSFSLDPEEDRDVLEWLDRQPYGQRSEMVVKALRAYMGASQVDPLEQVLERLAAMFEVNGPRFAALLARSLVDLGVRFEGAQDREGKGDPTTTAVDQDLLDALDELGG